MANAQAKAKVLIVDDHPLVCEGLRFRINGQPDLVVCGEAATVSEAAAMVRDCRPDLVILDLSLEGRGGLDLMKRLKDQYPSLPVLVFSMHDEMLYALRALEAGAKGYVMKREVGETLMLAIRRVLGGKIYVSDQVMSRFLDGVGTAPTGRRSQVLERLTDRELEVLEFMGQGLTGQQIARRLHLSGKTIEVYRSNIRQKLNLENAAQLAQWACAFVWGRDPLPERTGSGADETFTTDGADEDSTHDRT